MQLTAKWIDVGSMGWGVLEHMEITPNGLIWDLDVFNYGFGYVWFCIM